MTPPEVAGYQLRRVLGHGSGGEVWLATDRATGEAVAVKCVRPGADIATRDRLRREAAVLAGIDHPHVLRLRAVVGCSGSADEVALVLELATGGSLARLVARRGPLPDGEVVTVLVPLAEALAEVHARGVVHGDVTPANVLFAADGRPVLADLGVARLAAGGGPVETAGTPGFGDPHLGWAAGPATDVHGLAATCFLALTGAAPYDRAGTELRPADAGHGRLLDLLESVLRAPPEERPDARELARRAYACSAAAPVRLEPGSVVDVGDGLLDEAPLTVVSRHRLAVPPRPELPAGTAAGRPRSHRRPERSAGLGSVKSGSAGSGPAGSGLARPARLLTRWRSAATVLLGAVAVATAAVTGIAWAGSASGPGYVRGLVRPSAGPSSAAVDREPSSAATGAATGAAAAGDPSERTGAAAPEVRWAEVLAALDAERSAAFDTGDVERLADVYATGSPAGRRDRHQLQELQRAGLRAEGLRLDVRRVTEQEDRGTERQVRLRVVDVLRRHRLVDGAGAVVEHRPGRTARTWWVTLALEDGRWRVYDVTRV